MFVSFKLGEGADFILSVENNEAYPDGEVVGGIDVDLLDLLRCGILGFDELSDREETEIGDFFTQMIEEEGAWYRIFKEVERRLQTQTELNEAISVLTNS